MVMKDRPYLHDFVDVVSVAVIGAQHDEFTARWSADQEGGISLRLESDTRHHSGRRWQLGGGETVAQVLEVILRAIKFALAEDAEHRFRFRGVPIFAPA